MQPPPPRVVTLVLADAQGTVLGALVPFEAETPWWQDIEPVVRAVQLRDGLRVTVLRLLAAERDVAHGGGVTYLAQLEPAADRPMHLSSLPPLQPWHGTLHDDPKRLAYAQPGGPQADLAWAQGVLRSQGEALTGEARQIRTWNLSSIWRLPTRSGPAWLKVVPPFFAHEGAMLEALSHAPVPRLLGHDGARVLMADVAGDDRYEAPLGERLKMVDLLVSIQQPWLARAEELAALGLPDWRGIALSAKLRALVERHAAKLCDDDRAPLAAFTEGLDRRFADVAACGIGEGLVHGDFHPGNLRGDGPSLTLLDWGDCGRGHPLLDLPAFLSRTPADEAEATRTHWAAAWRHFIPGAEPERAAALLAPVAAARQALIYQTFLDHIEAAEQPYHRGDVADWLHQTAQRMRSESR